MLFVQHQIQARNPNYLLIRKSWIKTEMHAKIKVIKNLIGNFNSLHLLKQAKITQVFKNYYKICKKRKKYWTFLSKSNPKKWQNSRGILKEKIKEVA